MPNLEQGAIGKRPVTYALGGLAFTGQGAL
jgi:hypothetical protein